MTTLKNNEYIVFKPDQVLTNDHLNQVFYYLDRQNRLTRNKLIGMGIVCGFNLEAKTADNGNISCITITKGCGITSQGYLISDCDDKSYGYAIPYTSPDLPDDLPFKDNCKSIPFYNTDCLIYKLVTYDQYKIIIENPGSTTVIIPPSPCSSSKNTSSTSVNNGDQVNSSDTKQPVPLSSMNWVDYVVVLFLEAKEKDLKNCDMQDCNNKGEKMVFHIQPLLVPKKCVTNNCTSVNEKLKAPEIKLQRYNVPTADISNTANILNAFSTITSPVLLTEVANAYDFCFQKYKVSLEISTDPFSDMLNNLNNILSGLSNDPIMSQYFYDYINDLILAYYEFRKFTDTINVQCCADECLFPLHLVLGVAAKNSVPFIKDCYRTYFIYSPLFNGECNSIAKLKFYFNRMILLASQFPNASLTLPVVDEKSKQPIRITPSEYEEFPLSQRAIPYYYNEEPISNDSLYRNWNFEKSAEGNAAFNLSYNANLYNPFDAIVNKPLNYDIEKYNFFRIEGHIGLQYEQALFNILTQKQIYNLPFNVAAVAADKFYPTSLDWQAILSCLKNLITEFESTVIEFLCKLILCTRRLASLNYSALDEKAAVVQTDDTSLNPEQFLKTFQFGTSAYKMGDFINFMNPGKSSIGQTYLNALEKNQFSNVVDIRNVNCDNLESSKFFYTGFNILNAADNLFFALLNTKPQELKSSAISSQFNQFNTQFNLLKNEITASKNARVVTNLFDDCCDCLLCLYAELLWLIEQIIQRIRSYESEMIFSNYFKKHPGVEHKAGVPKGGTFVLVYSSANLNPEPVVKMQSFSAEDNIHIENKQPVIIADFYIPYLCCNDCTPVTYLVLPPPPPTISIAASPLKNPKQYCINDQNSYKITVSPENGVLNEDGTITSNFNFIPSVNSVGMHNFTYTQGEQSTTATVEVISVVTQAAITVTSQTYQDGGETLQFQINPVSSGYTYQWKFGDGSGDNGTNPQHVYSNQFINSLPTDSTDDNPYVMVSVAITNDQGCTSNISGKASFPAQILLRRKKTSKKRISSKKDEDKTTAKKRRNN